MCEARSAEPESSQNMPWTPAFAGVTAGVIQKWGLSLKASHWKVLGGCYISQHALQILGNIAEHIQGFEFHRFPAVVVINISRCLDNHDIVFWMDIDKLSVYANG